MAINRALLSKQLQAGAPDLRLTGDQRHRGTYTQRRARQMAAGGGIMGSNAGSMLVAPTADGSRPGYWGLPDWIPNPIEVIKKVGQTIIPGGETGYLDKDILEYINPFSVAQASEKIPDIATPPINPDDEYYESGEHWEITPDKESELSPWRKALATILPFGDPGYVEGGLYNALLSGRGLPELITSLPETIGGAIGKVAGLGEGQYGRYTIPLGIGAAMGKLQQDYLDRQPKFPADQTSINFQTAAEAMADPNLRFKPQAQYANVAEGGRIGYDTGKKVIDYNKDPEYRGWRKMYELNKDAAATNPKHDEYKKFYDTQGQAQGGRIGYSTGKGVDSLPRDEMREPRDQMKEIEGQTAGPQWWWDRVEHLEYLGYPYAEAIAIASNDEAYFQIVGGPKMAQGGRIGYQNAGPVEIPEEFLRDLKRRDFDKLLDDYRRWQQHQERLKNLGSGGQEVAQGGRIGAQEGGLMDLGGMEKDYRNEGGFVPIGGEEKADDVPARLSKNEFVFTADAVRNAGGGDIDEGAAIMERLMENLEAGGKVSEESQGLEGAREMFANAQQLEKRII